MYNLFGSVYIDLGNFSEALKYFHRYLVLRNETKSNQHPDVATVYSNIGICHCQQNELFEALEAHKKSLDLRTKAFGKIRMEVAASCSYLGIVTQKLGKFEEALHFL